MRSIGPRRPGTSATDAIHRSETWKDISDRCDAPIRDLGGGARASQRVACRSLRKDPCHVASRVYFGVDLVTDP
jgi:hypothetical protein